MKTAYLRFYAELNDFLPVDKRQRSFAYQFSLSPSVKDVVESCGVPHSEIDVILINHESVQFTYSLNNGDRVSIYPVFETFDMSPLIRLRAKPLRTTKFILDETLGKLTGKMRMLGFDSINEVAQDKSEFIHRALDEKRIILTKSRNLLKFKSISHGYWIRATEINEQIDEVISRFDLYSQIKPFTRCISCNGKIHAVQKEDITDLVPIKIIRYQRKFWQCKLCHKIYWQGSHHQKMLEQIKHIISEGQSDSINPQIPDIK